MSTEDEPFEPPVRHTWSRILRRKLVERGYSGAELEERFKSIRARVPSLVEADRLYEEYMETYRQRIRDRFEAEGVPEHDLDRKTDEFINRQLE